MPVRHSGAQFDYTFCYMLSPPHLTTPPSPHESSHAFIDDLLYRSESKQRISEILRFYDTLGRKWGRDINLSKTELHAMGAAPQASICAF